MGKIAEMWKYYKEAKNRVRASDAMPGSEAVALDAEFSMFIDAVDIVVEQLEQALDDLHSRVLGLEHDG